ncbi:MAG: alpha/beta hydrolase [Polyangiaceae bacterium]|jgi:non-heme chloroperoxidase|nr:alpha/beta hydrolase [Polyangiaceae bacterium]MBK8936239.1 alpha/beta hydrolase [Polyangiaceae bacterium]
MSTTGPFGWQGTEKTLEREDGTRLFTTSAGEGPPVVLAHGYLDEHLGQLDIATRLVRAGRRVILFDQRGHGRSTIGREGMTPAAMAADYVEVLTKHEVTDGVLMGHSMGGFLTTVFSILHPKIAKERLKGLVLVSAHAGDVAAGSPQNKVQIKLIEHGVMGLAVRAKPLARVIARSLFGKVVRPEWLDLSAETFQRADLKGTLPILKAQVEQSFYGRLSEIPIPAIVVCGEADKTCPRSHSERLGAKIPGSRNVWLPDIGHIVNFERPEAVVDAVEEQLRRPSSASSSARAEA